MQRHGISFKEATRQLFNAELVSLDINREAYETFRDLGSAMDTILVDDYVNGLGYANAALKHEIWEANEASAAAAASEHKGKGKGKQRQH